MLGNIRQYLTEPITIKRYTDTTDEWGNPSQGWATVETDNGRIRLLGGNEVFAGGQPTAKGTHRAYMIPPVDVTPADRVESGGKTYNVTYVNDVMQFGRILQIDLELIG